MKIYQDIGVYIFHKLITQYANQICTYEYLYLYVFTGSYVFALSVFK